jgi:hypothetical protein
MKKEYENGSDNDPAPHAGDRAKPAGKKADTDQDDGLSQRQAIPCTTTRAPQIPYHKSKAADFYVASTPIAHLPKAQPSVKLFQSKKSFINQSPALTKLPGHLKYGTFSFKIY